MRVEGQSFACLVSCYAVAVCCVGTGGCHQWVAVRPDLLVRDADNTVWVEQSGRARLDVRDYRDPVIVTGPARFFRRGDQLIVVETHRWSSVPLANLRAAYVSRSDPDRTAGMVTLVAVGIVATIVLLVVAANAIGDLDFSGGYGTAP